MVPHYFAIFILCVGAARLTITNAVEHPLRCLSVGSALIVALAVYESVEMFFLESSSILPRLPIVSFGFNLGSMLIVAGLVASEQRSRVLSPPVTSQLGDASYVLYLVHFPTI
jgi:peptidoglycan/LPS O-acetylase OafA/YrhL